MSYDVIKSLPNHLSLQDKEMIKGKLLLLHQQSCDQDTIVANLKRQYPILNDVIINNIVTSPEYLELLLNQHKARRVSDEGKIWDAVVEGAMNGNTKMIELYFKMTGRLKDQIALSRGKDDAPSDVKKLDDRDIEIQFQQAAENKYTPPADFR